MASSTNGTSPGSGHDQLMVGTAQPGGTLKLTLINGFVPTAEQTFDVVTYTSHTGAFLNVILTNFPGNLGASVTYSPTAVTVTVTSQ